jgi:hypothetical protein
MLEKYTYLLYLIVVNILDIETVLIHRPMSIDSKKLLERVRLKGESRKGRVGLYLDKDLYKEFQALCPGVSASEVVQELIRQFVEDARNKAKR